MQRILTFFDTRAGRFCRLALSVSLVAWFIWQVDWRELARMPGRFLAVPALIALILAGITYPLHGVRWWLLLRAQGFTLSLHWAHVVTWIGQFYNSFLLGGLGGDAARVFYLCRDAPEQKAAGLVSILVDRVIGLATLMSLAVLALVAKAGVLAREPGLRWIFIGALVLTCGMVGGTAVLLTFTPNRWPAWIQRALGASRVAKLADILMKIRLHPREHLYALAASYAIWVLDIFAVWFLADAVGLKLPLLETAIAISAAYAATALPISVGGHGVREGTLLTVLGLFGLVSATGPSRDAALLLAVLVWAITVAWSLVGGGVLLAAGRLLPLRHAPQAT
jgi:glycosyltransferase 2 family protein